MGCPRDTDGDGNCGNRRCLYCGGDGSLFTACKLCGEDTPYLGTKQCNECWELEKRIQANPTIARKVLAAIDAAEQVTPADIELLRQLGL